jgi:hypothetical protein
MYTYAVQDMLATELMYERMRNMNEMYGGINFRATEAWIEDFREEAAKDERERKLQLAKDLLVVFSGAVGDGDIVKFRKAYNKNGKEYTYAAIYIEATQLWYLTGKSEAASYTRESFIEFLVKGESATDLVWMNEGGAVL